MEMGPGTTIYISATTRICYYFAELYLNLQPKQNCYDKQKSFSACVELRVQLLVFTKEVILQLDVCLVIMQAGSIFFINHDAVILRGQKVKGHNDDTPWQWYSLSIRSIHYNDVIMGAMTYQITSLTIVYSTVLFRRRSKKTSKLGVTGLCAGNSPVTGEFPAQMAGNAEKAFIR